jgi:hypothetical protein
MQYIFPQEDSAELIFPLDKFFYNAHTNFEAIYLRSVNSFTRQLIIFQLYVILAQQTHQTHFLLCANIHITTSFQLRNWIYLQLSTTLSENIINKVNVMFPMTSASVLDCSVKYHYTTNSNNLFVYIYAINNNSDKYVTRYGVEHI